VIRERANCAGNLTVVLPNFNHGRYVGAAISILLSQLAEEDELIVYDDASTDDSVAQIDAAFYGHGAARLIRNETRLGVVANLNRGLADANGRYVYFAAADDRVAPDFLMKSRSLLDRYPQAGFCSALVRKIDSAGRDLGVIPTPIVTSDEGYLSSEKARKLLLETGDWAVGSATVYSCRPLREIGGFRPELGSFCDGFATQLLAVRHGACFLPEPLAFWRQLDGGYAARTVADISIATEIAECAVSLMGGRYRTDFAPGYAEKWRRRWLESNRRAALRLRFGNLLGSCLGIPSFLRFRAGDVPRAVARRVSYLGRGLKFF